MNKLKKRLTALKKEFAPPEPADGALGPMDRLVLGILLRDSKPADAAKGLATLREEYVDLNELRVAPVTEIEELVGAGIADRRAKALELTGALNRIFDEGKQLAMDYLEGMNKRELRVHLREKIGLGPYAEAYVYLYVFGGHAFPADEAMAKRLKAEALAPEKATVKDVQSLLEQAAGVKDARSAYEALVAFVGTPAARKSAGAKAKTVRKKSRSARKPESAKKVAKKAAPARSKRAKKGKKLAK